jgi:hypothetical protein
LKGGIDLGTYISLSILPKNISNSDWEDVYEESLKLVKSFPFAHVEEREYWGFKVPVYAHANEKIIPERHWAIMGDLHSKQYAETFRLYKDLEKYKAQQKYRVKRDILLEEEQQVYVFDSKTQGYQYHLCILAIAMLIESRFPKNALVSGNIDLEQCIKAKDWADQHLSQPIKLPVRVQIDQLFSRFSNFNNELERIDAIGSLLIAETEELFNMIHTYFSNETFHLWFFKKIKTFSSPNQLGALRLLIYYLNVTCNLKNLLYLCCKDERGPKFQATESIRATARTWICLPREKFSYLKYFEKVSGHPQIIERQFGTIILDMKFPGREIKTYIPLENVAEYLANIFPELEDQINSTLRQEMSRSEEELLTFKNQVQSAIELSERSTENRKYLADEDAFLYFGDNPVMLTEEQDLLLKSTAYSIKILLHKERDGILKQLFYGSIRNLKRIFTAFFIEKYNQILTEQAWEWINKTDDARLVRVLLAKLIIDDANDVKHHKDHSDLRKAMLENKALTEKIAKYMDDEVAMKQIEKYISQSD